MKFFSEVSGKGRPISLEDVALHKGKVRSATAYLNFRKDSRAGPHLQEPAERRLAR